jgi:hypothetical protein
MSEQERDLRKALRALCDMASINYPRNTDLTVGLSSSGPANGTLTIPVWLLSKLLEEPKDHGHE